jgi:endogenous inhibitor of DNA gyrase (YacG/DUF329 family)
MLIKCPECGHDVSSTAEKCPNCGAAVSQRDKEFVPGESNTIPLVEFTPKRYKAQRIWSWVVFFAGLLCFAQGAMVGGLNAWIRLSILLLALSIIWGAIISFNVWWHHR